MIFTNGTILCRFECLFKGIPKVVDEPVKEADTVEVKKEEAPKVEVRKDYSYSIHVC